MTRAQIAALTTTIDIEFPGVSQYAGGVVNAWQDKYGKRGALTQFLKITLDANPAGLRCHDLAAKVQRHFRLNVDSALERKRLLSVVRSRLVNSKEFELATGTRSGQRPLWRLAGRLPSVSTLAALREAADEPDQNPGH